MPPSPAAPPSDLDTIIQMTQEANTLNNNFGTFDTAGPRWGRLLSRPDGKIGVQDLVAVAFDTDASEENRQVAIDLTADYDENGKPCSLFFKGLDTAGGGGTGDYLIGKGDVAVFVQVMNTVNDILDAAAKNGQDVNTLSSSLLSLVNSSNFQALDGDAKIAVMSQAKNYPSENVICNLTRMAGKDWFKTCDLADKQCFSKLIADMSLPGLGLYGADTQLLNNTLDKLLGDDSPYSLKMEDFQVPAIGDVVQNFGEIDNNVIPISRSWISAGNGELGSPGPYYPNIDNDYPAKYTASCWIPSAINSLVNNVEVAPTFNYLNGEYRAWYVGQQATGRTPDNGDALNAWRSLLNQDGPFSGAAAGALSNPDEAAQIYDTLSKLTGVKVDQGNYRDVLDNPDRWLQSPDETAVVDPPGNLDNH